MKKHTITCSIIVFICLSFMCSCSINNATTRNNVEDILFNGIIYTPYDEFAQENMLFTPFLSDFYPISRGNSRIKISDDLCLDKMDYNQRFIYSPSVLGTTIYENTELGQLKVEDISHEDFDEIFLIYQTQEMIINDSEQVEMIAKFLLATEVNLSTATNQDDMVRFYGVLNKHGCIYGFNSGGINISVRDNSCYIVGEYADSLIPQEISQIIIDFIKGAQGTELG